MIKKWLLRISFVSLLLELPVVLACGGFFCQSVPINQAGEQIVFHQSGSTTTTMVQIQYAGSSENFAWVLPVPALPSLSIGSDLLFTSLETITRPQFNLDFQGEICPTEEGSLTAVPAPNTDVGSGGGVTIVETVAVGPFDAKIVSSDDPAALAIWLQDNNFDLSTQGTELLTPYIDANMFFVVLKLRQNQGVGDIQPLILRYESTQPMIPIKLTAVATQPDMGVLVWLLGEVRAVPLNYLHVVPNYTQLNWYNGSRNAYASYQTLITNAMNEAGGQGFATDFAGHIADLSNQLPGVDNFNTELMQISQTTDDALFISLLATNTVFPRSKIMEILRRTLILPPGSDEIVYSQTSSLNSLFTSQELLTARQTITTEINDTIIDALANSVELFSNDPYITRLYTTLSAEEMTLDPVFDFNPDMPTQTRSRNATLQASCLFNQTHWSLTLGSGTGRDGEVVLSGQGNPPNNLSGISQSSVWKTETTSVSGSPQVVTQNEFPVAKHKFGNDSGFGSVGVFTLIAFLGFIVTIALQKRRRH